MNNKDFIQVNSAGHKDAQHRTVELITAFGTAEMNLLKEINKVKQKLIEMVAELNGSENIFLEKVDKQRQALIKLLESLKIEIKTNGEKDGQEKD